MLSPSSLARDITRRDGPAAPREFGNLPGQEYLGGKAAAKVYIGTRMHEQRERQSGTGLAP